MYQNKRLIAPGTQLAAAPATIYTAPVGFKVQITKMVVVNTSTTTDYDFTLYWLAVGETAGVPRLVVPARTILAKESWVVLPILQQTLEPEDFLQALGSSANVLNIQATGTLMPT